MLREKVSNCIARTFHELTSAVDSLLRSTPEAELISVFQTRLRKLQHDIDSSGKHMERDNFD
jgi:hypothetical protein